MGKHRPDSPDSPISAAELIARLTRPVVDPDLDTDPIPIIDDPPTILIDRPLPPPPFFRYAPVVITVAIAGQLVSGAEALPLLATETGELPMADVDPGELPEIVLAAHQVSPEETSLRLSIAAAARAAAEDEQQAAAEVQAAAEQAEFDRRAEEERRRAEEAARAAEEERRAREAAAAEAARQEAAEAAGGPIVPGARLTSGFGARWGTTHQGIDLAAPVGTEIRTPLSGLVERAGPATGFGNAIYLRVDSGEVLVFGHMRTLYVTAGQRVSAGEVIALVGNEGQSTGPHLHFEVHVGGKKIDPLPWLSVHGVTL